MEVFGLSSAATVFSLARASLTRVLGLVLINKRPLNNGQQQKASSDRDITGRSIAFYGRVIYGSQVFARQKPPIRFLRVLCARFWTAGTISSWPFREISHSDYVHRRVHFRWLCELEHGDGYATSFFVPRGLTANFESRLIQGLWYKNIRIEYKHLFFIIDHFRKLHTFSHVSKHRRITLKNWISVFLLSSKYLSIISQYHLPTARAAHWYSGFLSRNATP